MSNSFAALRLTEEHVLERVLSSITIKNKNDNYIDGPSNISMKRHRHKSNVQCNTQEARTGTYAISAAATKSTTRRSHSKSCNLNNQQQTNLAIITTITIIAHNTLLLPPICDYNIYNDNSATCNDSHYNNYIESLIGEWMVEGTDGEDEEMERSMEGLEEEHRVKGGELRDSIDNHVINNVKINLTFIFDDEVDALDEYFNNCNMNTLNAHHHDHYYEYPLLGQEPQTAPETIGHPSEITSISPLTTILFDKVARARARTSTVYPTPYHRRFRGLQQRW